jgi:hypothetical protein
MVEQKLTFQFLSHCAALHSKGFITKSEVFEAILLLQTLDVDRRLFCVSPFNTVQEKST